MRDVVAMHARLGIRRPAVAGRHAPPPAGVRRRRAGRRDRVLSDDAIVHHDAVVWAHLDHLAAGSGTRSRSARTRRVTGIEREDGRVAPSMTDEAGSRRRSSSTRPAAGRASSTRWPACGMPNRPLRREVLVTAPLRRSIEAAVTFYRPSEGWFNQTLRGEVVMGAVDPDEPAGVNQRSSWDIPAADRRADDAQGAGAA